jgi:hypothetical protein
VNGTAHQTRVSIAKDVDEGLDGRGELVIGSCEGVEKGEGAGRRQESAGLIGAGKEALTWYWKQVSKP